MTTQWGLNLPLKVKLAEGVELIIDVKGLKDRYVMWTRHYKSGSKVVYKDTGYVYFTTREICMRYAVLIRMFARSSNLHPKDPSTSSRRGKKGAIDTYKLHVEDKQKSYFPFRGYGGFQL